MATETRVIVGEIGVGLTDLDTFFSEDEADEGINIYNDTTIDNRYEKDYHRYMMGITSPDGFQGNHAAFVQLASPTLLWIVDWTIARWNKQPDIPNSESNDPNWILLDEHFDTHNLHVNPEGDVPFYRISGTYVYGCVNPSSSTLNNVNFPRPPWLDDSIDRSMPLASMKDNLSNTAKKSSRAAPGVPASEGYVVETF